MGKIAGLIIPATRRRGLPVATRQVTEALAYGRGAEVERATGVHGDAAVLLVRVGPDPINPAVQPTSLPGGKGVACGYYLSGGRKGGDPRSADARPDSASNLLADVDANGAGGLPDADGVYAFLYWNPARQTLSAGVDKLGLRPLYWSSLAGGGYAVASEPKGLVPLLSNLVPNWAAWEELLSFGDLFGDHTPIEGVHRFGPAEVIDFRIGGQRARRLESFLESIEPREVGTDDYLEANAEALDRAVDRCLGVLPAETRPMLTLSGGYDSRRLLGALVRSGQRPSVYTVPLVQPDGTECEAGIAQRLSEQFALPCHVAFPPDVESWPLVARARDLLVDFESHEHEFATVLALAVPAGPHVNLDGFGGDVFVNGAYLKPGYFSGVPAFERKFFGYRADWFRLPATAPPLAERVRGFLRPFRQNPHWVSLFYFYSHSRRGTSLAPTTIQGSSFESLFPFADREFVASGLSMPPDVLGSRHLQREAIDRMELDLLRVPTAYDVSPRSPRGVVTRHPEWALRHRLHQLRQSVRRASPLGSVLPSGQRLRLAAIGRLGWTLSPEVLRWQFRKARDLERLATHLRLAESVEAYAEGIRTLRSAFDGKEGWLERVV